MPTDGVDNRPWQVAVTIALAPLLQRAAVRVARPAAIISRNGAADLLEDVAGRLDLLGDDHAKLAAIPRSASWTTSMVLGHRAPTASSRTAGFRMSTGSSRKNGLYDLEPAGIAPMRADDDGRWYVADIRDIAATRTQMKQRKAV